MVFGSAFLAGTSVSGKSCPEKSQSDDWLGRQVGNRFAINRRLIWGLVGVRLGSTWILCGVHLGSVSGPVWGPFGVHIETWQGFEPRNHGTRFLIPWTDLLGAPLGLIVGPMVAPSWQLLGILEHFRAFLERSRAYLETVFDQ